MAGTWRRWSRVRRTKLVVAEARGRGGGNSRSMSGEFVDDYRRRCSVCGIGWSLRFLASVVVEGWVLCSVVVRMEALWKRYTADTGGSNGSFDPAVLPPPNAASTRQSRDFEYWVVAAGARVRHSRVRTAPCLAPAVVWRATGYAGGVYSEWLWRRCFVRIGVVDARCGARKVAASRTESAFGEECGVGVVRY